MAYELKPNSGNLFVNTYKKDDKHPDYKGSIRLPDGTLMNIAAWLKKGQKGEFYSLSLSVPKEREQKDYTPPEAESDTPF
jgi:hypothetical protein